MDSAAPSWPNAGGWRRSSSRTSCVAPRVSTRWSPGTRRCWARRSCTPTGCSPFSPTTTSITASPSPASPAWRTSRDCRRDRSHRVLLRRSRRPAVHLCRLKRAGIEPYWCINHGPTTSLYYKDPDGNRVELQVDNFPTADACNRWMHSGDFAANPIGVVFDPDQLLARYEAGEPIEHLTARPRSRGDEPVRHAAPLTAHPHLNSGLNG